jgi:hypothetical protein
VRTRNVLLTDLGIAIVAAILVLILTPGLAIAAIVAIVVLIGCAVSFRIEARRRRHVPNLSARERAAQRAASRTQRGSRSRPR